MAAYLISFLPLFLSRRFINADRTSLLWLRYLYISILFLGAKLLFEHPWHAIDVFVRLPECHFSSAIILLPKKVFYFTLIYLETDRLINSSSVAAGNGVSVTPIGHVVLLLLRRVILL